MIDYKGYTYNSIFYYSKLDPRSLDSDAYSSDSIRYVETCYWRKNSNDKTVDTYLTFRVEDNTITLYKIVEGDRTFDEKEMTAWIDDCYNFKAKEQGKKYIKEGMYISDTQKLYSSPDYDSATTYTYNYSGIKTIIGYKVTEDGTLWLKLNGSSDGKYKYFWVPES